MTVPSETVGAAAPVLPAFFAIQSRAARMLSSVPGFILADSDREPAPRGADKRITHETLNRPDDLFHFRLISLDNVKERFRSFAGIMHDIPPTFSKANLEEATLRYKPRLGSRTFRKEFARGLGGFPNSLII
jgi:hypothetical protein